MITSKNVPTHYGQVKTEAKRMMRPYHNVSAWQQKGEVMPRTKKKITPSNKKPEPRRKANGMGSIRQKTVKGKVYWEGRYSVTDPLTGKIKQRSVSGTDKTEVEKSCVRYLSKLTRGPTQNHPK